MEVEEITYALSRQVEDIRRGCLIHTSHGDLYLDGQDAEVLAGMVKLILERRLAVALGNAMSGEVETGRGNALVA